MRKIALAALAVTALVSSPAFALTYSESASGDIDAYTAAVDAFGQPTRNFLALSVGSNVFTGSINSPSDPSDVLPFQVLAGQQVTSVIFTLSNVAINQSARFDLENTFGQTFISQDLGNVNSTVALDPGTYSLLIGGGTNVASYSLTLNVRSTAVTPPPATSNVPEPASWAMMVAGFGLAGTAMRRRRAAVSFA